MNPIELEIVADNFEANWAQRSRREIEDLLETSRHNFALLVELVHADLELRLKSGESARVESYLEPYPELGQDLEIVESLLKTEYGMRERREPEINFSEFVIRFPDHYSCLVDSTEERRSTDNLQEVMSESQVDRSYVSKRFSMERIQAEGGLGNVWLAHDHELDRKVALKEIKNKHAANPKYQSRFVQEALITGALDHPGVAPVYSLGHFRDGRPYYAMRLIRGKSLRTKIGDFHQSNCVARRGIKQNLEFRRLLQNLLDACNTIEFAHSKGVIHRDIKPGNIMVGQYGETLVVDWGLARFQTDQASDDESLQVESHHDTISSLRQCETTIEGQAIGSPAFMSPEQALGDLAAVSFPSDVYGLGASLFNLVTGHTRPQGSNGNELKRASDVAQELQPLISIARVAMSHQPSDRFESPGVFAESVEKFLANEPVDCHQESFLEKLERVTRRHSGLVRSVAIASVLVALIAIFAAVRINSEKQIASTALAIAKEARSGERKAKEEALASLDEEQKAREAVMGLKKDTDDLGRKLIETFSQYSPVNRGLPPSVINQLDVLRERLPEESPQLEVLRLTTLGQIEKSLGNLDDAIVSFENALEIIRGLGEVRSADYAAINLNLAKAYYAQGRTSDSEVCLKVVFDEEFSKPEFANHRMGAHSLSAQIERDRNNLNLAQERATQALELAITTFGQDDVQAQVATDQLAGIYSLMNDKKTALRMYERLIAQQSEKGFEGTRAGLMARRNYGVVLQELNRFAEAVRVMEDVVVDRVRMFRSDDLETLDAQMMLGHAKYKLALRKKVAGGGEFDIAAGQLEKTFSDHVEHFGMTHPQTAKNAVYLIEAWCGTARFKERKLHQERDRLARAIEIADQLRQHHGKHFVTCNRVDNQVSRYFERLKDLPTALKYSELAVEGVVIRAGNPKSFEDLDRRDVAILSAHALRNYRVGNFEEAVYWLDRIEKSDKRLAALTACLVELKDFSRARDIYYELESGTSQDLKLLELMLYNLDFLESLFEEGRLRKTLKRSPRILRRFTESIAFQKFAEIRRERIISILNSLEEVKTP